MINRVNIAGNVGKEPELRTTAGGKHVLGFSVAVNERRKNQNGEYADYTHWIPCVVFGSRAESLARFIHKGDKLAVDGKLNYSQWQKDGQSRYKLEVIVDDVEFMTRRDGQQKDPGTQAVESYFGVTAQEVYDDVEIPF